MQSRTSPQMSRNEANGRFAASYLFVGCMPNQGVPCFLMRVM